MTAKVSLNAVVQELEAQMEEASSYVNRKTGEVFALADEELRAAEDEADLDDYPEWQHAAIEAAKRVLASDDFLRLPDQFEIHEWSIMEQFCQSIKDVALRDDLFRAIRGRGAFRHFKDLIHCRGIEDRWHEFRDDALKQIAIDWLEEQDIEYET